MKNAEAKFCQHCGGELNKKQSTLDAVMDWMKEEESKNGDTENKGNDDLKVSSGKKAK